MDGIVQQLRIGLMRKRYTFPIPVHGGKIHCITDPSHG
jgi:hypothetical protein